MLSSLVVRSPVQLLQKSVYVLGCVVGQAASSFQIAVVTEYVSGVCQFRGVIKLIWRHEADACKSRDYILAIKFWAFTLVNLNSLQ